MRNLYRHLILIVVVVALSIWAVVPPEKKLKLAKDLAGGATLVYQVDVRPTDPPDTVNRVKDLISQRLDPSGTLDIQLMTVGNNRIEIAMPLPTEAVKRKRVAFETELAKIGSGSLRSQDVDRLVKLTGEARTAELSKLGGGNAERVKILTETVVAYEAMIAERAKFDPQREGLNKAVDDARKAAEAAVASGASPEALKVNQDALTKAEDALFAAGEATARAELAFDAAKARAVQSVLSIAELRRVLDSSTQERRFSQGDGTVTRIASPRAQAIERLKKEHPGSAADIERILASWNEYQQERSTFDDPADVKRLLRGAGVLDFRITVGFNDPIGIAQFRDNLRQNGPRASRAGDQARWFKINKLDGWFQSAEDYVRYEAEKGAFFARLGYVVEEFDGEPYMLCYDTPGMRLTQAEGSWSVTGAGATVDELGRPAIRFSTDPVGGGKLGALTEANLGRQMAVLLDDQVYTAPNLKGKISTTGIITGQFDQAEITYISRVLGSGSMAAKLSPEPVSQSTVGPELGADNLQRGVYAGIFSFALVAACMVVYYFGCGLVAVLALLINGLLILAIMAVNLSPFSLPGIAGVVLTFGMAVDANVLIYERMREEMQDGADFRTAVRLGYSRAMGSIIDGNMTVLIVCVVLATMGTQEIKGFAITMIIGSLTTFFTQLYVTRVLFWLLVEKLGWRNGTMLAVKFPVISRLLTPSIDWMKYRWGMLGLSMLLVVLSAWVVFGLRGTDVLDNDFRGGTKVTVQLRADAEGKPASMTLAEARERVAKAATARGAEANEFRESAEVLAINPDPNDATRASRFTIKTVSTNAPIVTSTVTQAFADMLDLQPRIRFAGDEIADARSAPVRPITVPILGDVIGQPALRQNVSEYLGGAAIVLENLTPAQSLTQLNERLRLMRNDPGHTTASSRPHEWVIVDGDERAIKSAILLVRDDAINFLQDRGRWEGELRAQEWKLVSEAFAREQSLSGVENFSPAIAQTFVQQAIIAVALSAVLIAIYIWLRFQSFRYSIGAMLSTLHDCAVATGAIAACGLLVKHYPGVASALGIESFKIDLNVMAAVLTILGYSLNDTVIVMDRIRETKGKSPWATRQIVNSAVNSTLSRTFITAGLVMIATLILYVEGGEAIRPFAFTFLIGVLTGTYSSIFIAAPMTYVARMDPSLAGKGKAVTA